MKLAIVNPISQTSPDRWSVPPVTSNAQSITVQMARELCRLGTDVTVFMAAPFTPAVPDEGVSVKYLPVIPTPLSPPAQIPFMPSLVREVRAGRFDAVVSSELFQWSTLSLALSRQMPHLFVWHEADAYQRFMGTLPARIYHGTAGRLVVHRAAGVIPRTQRAAQFLLANGVPQEKLGPEVPNGIATDLFGPDLELRAEQPLILYVGSLIERKNPSLAVRAMPYVLSEEPSAALLMKGFGEQEGLLRRLADEIGVSSSVMFDSSRSSHDEMSGIYNRAWVAVFPSFRDFASLSPIEAVACRVPVVLSERLFSAEYLAATGCGIPVSDDPSRFADAVVRHIRQYGRQGLPEGRVQPVRERFALRSAAGRLLEYITAFEGWRR